MDKSILSRVIRISLVVLLIGTSCTSISGSQQVNRIGQSSNVIDGQILLAPMWGTTTYLIDNTGAVNHTWSSNFFPGVGVRWVGDGTILRTIRIDGGPGSGGGGGGVQKVQWDGTVVWDFRYNTNGVLSHHDVKMLPNGNVLMIAWEIKTRNEAIAAGRNPIYVSALGLMPDHVIEVHPTGPTSGDIVWEWHVWDHLIQDYDSSKENYGAIGDHPELVDINYGVNAVSIDWLHTNSIDYNPEFDQILLSVCNLNEIWVIDHSTTTEEAAGHAGGNSGKGGDLLYRWGNPQAYDTGTSDDQKLFGQHDASWIPPGYPGAGDILIFNNGIYRPGSYYSSIDEIVPPVNESGGYYLEPGSAYGPTAQAWIYTASPPTSFYASHLSGAQRLADGDTLICNGETGKIFEVTPQGTTIWQYTSPYPTPLTNQLFKVVYIPFEEPEQPGNTTPDLDCSGILSWTKVDPGTTVTGSFQVQNIGDPGSLLNWSINTSSINWGTWSFSPQSGENLTPEDGQLTVSVSVIAPDEKNAYFEAYLKVENQQDPQDFDVIPVTLTTPTDIHNAHQTVLQSLIDLMLHHTVINHLLFLRTFIKNQSVR
jgi:hypothetical protein